MKAEGGNGKTPEKAFREGLKKTQKTEAPKTKKAANSRLNPITQKGPLSGQYHLCTNKKMI